jgi:hypothetical protein
MYYEENYCETKIKPKLIAKMPFRGATNDFYILDAFIDMSPGLEFLKARGCLISVIHSTSTSFYTDCENCYGRYKEKYTENVAICNLKVFFASVTDEDTGEIKKPTKLRKLLDELHGKDEDEEEFHDSATRAENILKLIRSRQQKPKKPEDEK